MTEKLILALPSLTNQLGPGLIRAGGAHGIPPDHSAKLAQTSDSVTSLLILFVSEVVSINRAYVHHSSFS